MKECIKMYKFDHPNVIKLLGVCLDGGPAPFIVMPFMTNGSLLAYLKEMRGVLVLDPTVQQDNMVRSLGGCHFIHQALSRLEFLLPQPQSLSFYLLYMKLECLVCDYMHISLEPS